MSFENAENRLTETEQSREAQNLSNFVQDLARSESTSQSRRPETSDTDPSDGAPQVSISDHAAENKAMRLVTELPEVKEWLKLFDRPDGSSKLGGYPVIEVDSQKGNIVTVHAYERLEDHDATLDFYNVDIVSGKVKSNLDSVKEDEAMRLVTDRPEVKAWLNLFDRPDGSSKLGGRPVIDVDRHEGNNIIVHVYEQLEDHTATLHFYNVVNGEAKPMS